MMNQLWRDESGILTFEWILLITVLVIGIIGGVAAIRDALIIESAETAGAIVALDQSWAMAANQKKIEIESAASGSSSSFSYTFSHKIGNPNGNVNYTDHPGKITLGN